MALPRYTFAAPAADQSKLKKLEALASLPPEFELHPDDVEALQDVVETAVGQGAGTLERVKDIAAAAGENLERLDPDPAQARLNLQLALSQLVSDRNVQELARTQGRQFQIYYNLTNDQMLTLCRLAVDAGAYQNTDDLNAYLDAFKDLDPTIKSLSPGALEKLGLGNLGDGLIGSCSCCCP
jgi:hypothetical protein